jgi:hypothetical protein
MLLLVGYILRQLLKQLTINVWRVRSEPLVLIPAKLSVLLTSPLYNEETQTAAPFCIRDPPTPLGGQPQE